MSRSFPAIVQAEAIGFDLFHIYFKYGELKMYITSQGEGKTITAEVSNFPPQTKFKWNLIIHSEKSFNPLTANSTERGPMPVTGQVARKSSRPKSCRPERESCCPKFIVMSPEIVSSV